MTNLSVFFNNFEIKICRDKHHKNGEKYLFFRRLALEINTKKTYISFIRAKNGQMLNFIGVNFKACTLGQKDNFWKVVIYNGFVYHVVPVMPCSD